MVIRERPRCRKVILELLNDTDNYPYVTLNDIASGLYVFCEISSTFSKGLQLQARKMLRERIDG